MKRTISALIAVFFVLGLCGCGHMSVDEDQVKETLVRIAARRVAVKFLEKNPDQVETVRIYCNAVINNEIDQVIIDTAINYLANRIDENDELLRQDLKDLSGLVVIDVSDSDFDADLIRVIALGFIEATRFRQ